jgi:hypothetical protein
MPLISCETHTSEVECKNPRRHPALDVSDWLKRLSLAAQTKGQIRTLFHLLFEKDALGVDRPRAQSGGAGKAEEHQSENPPALDHHA